ncbi:MAG: membrane protein insertase YidC [Desulfobacteraceae bacterium]
MNDEKRLLLAIVLSVVVILGWNVFFMKPGLQGTDQAVETAKTSSRDTQDLKPRVSDFTDQENKKQSEETDGNASASEDLRTVTVETPLYNIAISEGDGSVQSFTLKEYRESNSKKSGYKELVPSEAASGLFSMEFFNGTVPGVNSSSYTLSGPADGARITQGSETLTFTLETESGVIVEKVFTFHADSYLIDCDIVVKNGSDRPVKDAIALYVPGFKDKGGSRMSQFAFEGPVALVDNDLKEVDPDDIEDKDTFHGVVKWAGYTDRYFLSCVIPESSGSESMLKLSRSGSKTKTGYIQPMDRLEPGKMTRYSFNFFMGPKSLKLLSDYNNSLKKAINFGWFDFLAKPLLIVMNFIHQLIPNYGVAIILLTVLIKIVFWPLGTKSYKSMNEMKKVQPLMQEIREKHKDDKQKMNQEVMALYKTYKVNPMSGCLPMLVQMPIFLALYRMLYQAIELRHAPFILWIQDLSAPDRLFEFDFAIPFMQEPYGIPVLTIIMGASFLLQQKMTPTAGDPTQAKIMMLMPIFMTVIFINFPAGLVLYIFANNLISMGQQYYIQKKFS